MIELGALAILLAAPVAEAATSCAVGSVATGTTRSGAHDFDFEFGRWRVHHRVKRPGGVAGWDEYEGVSEVRPLLGGDGNVEDNVFLKPGWTSRGAAVRAYDAKSATWAIWWIDGRNPHGVPDPPVKGRFANGVGKFYSAGVVVGVPTCTRFTWTVVTANNARWEQAYSTDQGRSWDTNWMMDFRRAE